jgi:predicted nucleotidyltransferase component of viral defense system
MNDKPKNMAASVRQRLRNRPRDEGQDFQRLLVRYGIERLLYRLSQSPVRDRFVLKGAMLFALWSPEPFRSTGDLDLLGFGANDVATVHRAFAEICRQEVPDDGLVFDANTIRVEPAREDEEYQGARVRLDARLGTAVIALQVDIGFGDVIHPAPKELDYPCLIDDLPSAHIRAYPPETVIAEKLEAMVRFDEQTSRLKDHYDIWVLSHTFPFKKATLATAIEKTFKQRGTGVPAELPAPLVPAFAARADKQVQWDAFLRRTAPTLAPPPFVEVLVELRRFLEPVIAAINDGAKPLNGEWNPSDGWV